MTYRDDHEAALRRAEALEVELEAARADAATARQALDASEAERARLADELARTPPGALAAPRRPVHPTDPPPRPPMTTLDLVASAMVALLLATSLAVVVGIITQ